MLYIRVQKDSSVFICVLSFIYSILKLVLC